MELFTFIFTQIIKEFVGGNAIILWRRLWGDKRPRSKILKDYEQIIMLTGAIVLMFSVILFVKVLDYLDGIR